MDMGDFVEPEVGVAIAVTAAVASPKVRKVLRRGAVYGLAGIMKVKDVITHAAHSVVQSAKDAAAHLRPEQEEASEAAPAPRKKVRTA